MIKLAIFNLLCQEGDVNLVVDTAIEGVDIPPYLYGRMANFIVGNSPSPNLKTDEQGISAPMRFGDTKFVCYFPWAAVKAMVSRRAVVNFPPDGEKGHEDKSRKSTPPLKIVK
ncbi:MAG: hypothetical protein JXD19_10740 [Deltaproteobacteria bacterium]|nr:hypothetical protein [Deltaproteobacteria bacterium]